MANLLELSEYLKVQAEVLRQRLIDAGQDPPGLEDLLPQETIDWLVSEFHSSDVSGPPPKSSLPQEPVGEDLPSDLGLADLEALEEDNQTDNTSQETDDGEAPRQESESPSSSEESTPEPEEDEDKTLIQEKPGEEVIPPSPDSPEEDQKEDLDSRRSVGGLVFSEEQRTTLEPTPPKAEDSTEPESLLETLEQVESMRQDLGGGEGASEIEDFRIEEGVEEAPPSPDWETFEEVEPDEAAPTAVDSGSPESELGEASSEELQLRVDQLFAELPSTSHLSATGEPIPPIIVQIRERLQSFYESLSLKQKVLIASAGIASVLIFFRGCGDQPTELWKRRR